MTREDSKRDVDRISLNSGETLNPVKMRVGQTQAWVRLPQRHPGLRLEPVPQPESRRRPKGWLQSSPRIRLGSGPGPPRGGSRRGDVFPEPAPEDAPRMGPSRPQTGLSSTPGLASPTNLFGGYPDILCRLETDCRQTPNLKTASIRVPRCLVPLPIAAPLAPTRRRRRRRLQRQLQQTIWRTRRTATRNGQTT